MLGRGKFGTVYRMINPHDQHVFAVKELTNLSRPDGSPDKDAMEELLLEVRKLGTVNSEFILKYHTSAIFRGHFYMVTELIVSSIVAPHRHALFKTPSIENDAPPFVLGVRSVEQSTATC